MTENKISSAKFESTKLNTKASVISSMVKLYEAAASIVAASFASTDKGDKKKAEFAQKELEMWSKRIDALLEVE